MPDTTTHTFRQQFALRLRACRIARGFRTAKSFAEALGVDQNTYTRYERGDAEPNLALIERIWSTLALPPSDLFGMSMFGGRGPAALQQSESAFAATRPPGAVGPHERIAWHLAERLADVAHERGEDRQAADLGQLQAAARIYLDLLADPLAALARVLSEIPVDRLSVGEREELAAQVRRLVENLAGKAPAPRARQDKPKVSRRTRSSRITAR